MKPKKSRRQFHLIDKIALGLNIVTAICLILSYLAPSTDPRDSVIIATLGFGYLFLVGANLIFVIYWVFRKPLLMLISLVCVLLGFQMMSAQYGFRKQLIANEKIDSNSVRVMQYNVHGLKGIDRFEDMPIQNEVLDIIGNKQPDILNLEEFVKYKVNRDSISNQIKTTYNLKYAYFNIDKVIRGDSTGNIMFSRYPIINAGEVDPRNLVNTKAIFIDIKYKGKIVRVYCIHLIAVEIKARSKKKILSGSAGIDNTTFIFNKLTGAFVTRSYQVDQIKRSFDSCPYPFIVTGDFNDTPISYAVNELGDGLKNAFVEKGSGLQTTYYSTLPLQIDYIFASKQFDILNYQAVNKKISDHKAIISDLKLK